MTYKDNTKPAAERAELLLGQMTLEEKIGQMLQPFGWKVFEKKDGEAAVTAEFAERLAKQGVGSLYGTLRADPWTGVTLADGLSPREGAELLNRVQRAAIEQSRLGIPILFGEECSHGHMAIGATVFPVPLSMGSSWNVELYRRVCRAIALETRSQGGAVTYSPVLDVVRDPRWGRTEECFAEDPYLIAQFAVASVEGLQGESLASQDSVAATLKHFAGYGSSEGGRNAGPVRMGMRELRDVDLLPFRKAVEAGARSVMTAYNEVDGVPCTSSEELLDGLLRREWGFEGLVITDCGAIDMLIEGHDVADGKPQAAAMSVKAGVDMEMSGHILEKALLEALSSGLLEEADVDRAVRRILTLKFELGLFDNPYADPDLAERSIGCEEHAALARQIAAEGTVLLKNEGGLLPLRKDSGVIALIGPNADQLYNQLGDYTSPQPRANIATVKDGIEAKLGTESGRLLYAPGCRINGDSREGFAAAIACAERADTIVAVLGGSSARDFGEGTINLTTGASVVTGHSWSDMDCGEGIDRSGLALSGVQLELLKELHKLGKPIVLVYINGRPVAEPWIDEHIPAIMEAWYPGQEGGHAIADLLFGDLNPSGKLTVSIPKDVGQLPVYYNGKRSRGKRYLEMDSKPRYPFGYGLSYTTFKYEGLVVEPERMKADGEAVVRVTVSNTGPVAGDEVVQLYISDRTSSVTRPFKELKGFEKIGLKPGESREVAFTVSAEHLQFTGADGQPVVEPGRFDIIIGTGGETFAAAGLTIEEDN
ncbi:glycoside hydrolase family 3 C-terminal domain-containing protein [Paenibacillus sp. N4]|uniref:glycoside hydrolase family 3 N-terminal domain-containing protein n=1 Tax=Paenibacillus vietnamensis TaxID=2590547 RepID=UPI001CD0C5A0|nr:glycoside hydrolase family 3 N-terminal domain-containing protein [Paenibacillus vietnamensis]MCA0755123.1 glycoside hydrolase family 3 C-terminal domain-containing protein [Paenibacillus vietnamensis]